MTNPEKEQNIRETDYQEGYDNELRILDKLKKQGGNIIIEPTDRYCFYDYLINDKYLCEVKKRNIIKDKYDTTIFPLSKIRAYQRIKKDYKDLILIFCFTDSDYYINYKKLIKYQNDIKIKRFTRYSGFQHASRKHLFIPTALLSPLTELTLKC